MPRLADGNNHNVPQWVATILLTISDYPLVLLLLINLVLLFVGSFMDMTPAVLIFTPIFLPIAVQLGMSPLHFGIMMVLNLSNGLCTPPVGSVLFVSSAVADTTVQRMVRPLLPMYAMQPCLSRYFWWLMCLQLARHCHAILG